MANSVIAPAVWTAFGPYTVTLSSFAAIDILLEQLDDTAVELTLTIPAGATVTLVRQPVDWSASGTVILSGGAWVAAPPALGDWGVSVSPGAAATDPCVLSLSSGTSNAGGILRIIVGGAGAQPIMVEGSAGLLSIDRVLAAPSLSGIGIASPVPARERQTVALTATVAHTRVANAMPATALGAPPAILAVWSEDAANMLALTDFASMAVPGGANASFTAPGIYQEETLGFTITATLDLDASVTATAGEPATSEDLDVTIETALYRLALVIDRSGSMSGSLGGGMSKWTAAIRAAHAWSDVFRAFRPQDGHLAGVVTFESNQGGWGTPALANQITFRNPASGGTLPGMSELADFDAINAWNLGGPQSWTPIGDGLVRAWQGIHGNGTGTYTGAVILLTDGYENAGLVSLRSPAPAGATSFGGRRLQADLLAANQQIGGNVYTLGIGSSVDEDALNTLGTNAYRQITQSTVEIQQGVVEMLGHIVDAQQLPPVAGPPDGRLYFQQSSNESVLIFLVWWDDITGNLLLARSDQGANAYGPVNVTDPGVTLNKRAKHGLVRVDLREFFAPAPVPAGDWRLEHVTGAAVQIPLISDNALAMVDLHTKAEIAFDREQYLIGQPIQLTCRIRAGAERVTGATVRVECARPGEGLGTFLATNWGRYSPGQGQSISSTSTSNSKNNGLDPNAGKALMYQTLLQLTDREHLPIVQAPTFALFDDGAHDDGAAGNGNYANSFTDTDKEGSYTFRFHVEGTLADGSAFSRMFVRSTWVGVAVDPGSLIFTWSVAQVQGSMAVSVASFTPRAANGEFLGPFRTGVIDMVAHGGTLDGPLTDNLDGSYSQSVKHARGVDPILVPTIYGTPMVPAGPGIDPPGSKRDCCRLWHRALRCTIDGIKRLFGG